MIINESRSDAALAAVRLGPGRCGSGGGAALEAARLTSDPAPALRCRRDGPHHLSVQTHPQSGY